MTRLHPDDVKALAQQIVAELRRPVLVAGGLPVGLLELSPVELEARLRSESRAHHPQRRKAAKH